MVHIRIIDRSVRVPVAPGQTMLEALRDADCYIPALCSGRGVCGQCKVRVAEGALEPAAEDISFFTPGEIAGGWRLACVAVPAADVTIEIPRSSGEGRFDILSHYEDGGFAPGGSGFVAEALAPEEARISFSAALRAKYPGAHIPLALLEKAAAWIALDDRAHVRVLRDAARNRFVDVVGESDAAYGVAVDIGTTTLGFALLDLFSGKTLSVYSRINRQREYGGDVITRIKNAGEGMLGALSGSIRQDIAESLPILCAQAGADPARVYAVAATGNTTMLHLLLGVPCRSLGLFPFTAVTTSADVFPLREILGDINGIAAESCELHVLPGITTYIGADVTAGIFYCGIQNAEKPALLIDIGTNGEMALCADGRIYCASTAAGPAFEGGNISCGIGSVPGAIAKIAYIDGQFQCETIGNAPPAGICGSGILDLGAALSTHGFIDETGVFADDYFDDGVEIAPGIVFTQKDMRELQLAKSAVRAGIEILLSTAGLAYKDVGRVYLAGGFGVHMDLNSAAAIRLIPAELKAVTVSAGNSALGGCVRYLLSAEARGDYAELAERAEEVALSTHRDFNDLFMEYMMFEETV